jgi:endonuclease/exonuclease/phosphatase (EEP) superfamily protein YafD
VLTQHGPVVVLGDLNTVPWSAALHGLERDAHLSSSSDGFGLQASWPSLAGFVGLPIDQLLTSRDLTATRRQTRGGFSSSHRSVWVELAATHRIA